MTGTCLKRSIITVLWTLSWAGARLSCVLMIFAACVPATNPDGLVSDDTVALKLDAQDDCSGDAMTDSPFANSTKGANGLTPATAYKICTAAQFNRIGTSTSYWSRYFVIKNNLNFIEINSAAYNKIGVDGGTPFTGQIDGKGYYIINFIMTSMGTQAGLISYLGTGGVLKNIKFSNTTVSGTDDVGVLVGKNNGGTISNVEMTVTNVVGTSNVGAIVGYNKSGKISSAIATLKCNTCPFATGSYVGGAVGLMDAGVVSGVTLTGKSLAGTIGVGGLVGKNTNGFLTQSSVTLTGNITGTNYVGGMIGQNEGNIYGTTATFKDLSSTAGSFVGGMAGTNEGGTIQDSTLVIKGTASAAQYLGGLVGHNTSGELLGLKGTIYTISGDNSGSFIGGGVGHNQGTMENVNVVITKDVDCPVGTSVGGLVGFNQGDISSSSTEAESVKGGVGIGGLIGTNDSADIDSSSAKIKTLVRSTNNKVGGLIGDNDGSIITSSYFTGAQIVGSTNVGGLIGINNDSTIRDSNATVTTSISGTQYVGGLVGQNISSNIETSYANIELMSATEYVGGFIGRAELSTILNSFAVTDETITAVNNFAGGFAGYVLDTTILNTYSKFKKVQGLENVGGHTGEAEATWNGSGVGAGSGSGYQISYSFSMGEVVGAQAACPDPTLPTVGVFVGSFAFAGDDSTDDPFRTIYKFDENYVLDTEDCTNTGCNQCNNDFVEGLNDDGPIELLSEFIPEEDPFECDTEFDICTCVPTTGTVCMEILETNFMNAEDAPLTFWNFGVTWKDNYGQLPTLQ